MHFHLPKPLHGWRAFVGEVGIIVPGVLIALSAEQVVGWLRDRETVHQIRSAMMSELSEDRTRVEWLQAQDKCVSSRLNEISAWAATAPLAGHLDGWQRPRLWSVHSNAWELAKTSQAAEYIALKERLTAASLYDSMNRLERFLVDEDHDWKLINSLANAAVTQDGRVQLARAIAAARYDVMRRETSLGSLYRRFDELGVRTDPAVNRSLGSPDQLCATQAVSAPLPTE